MTKTPRRTSRWLSVASCIALAAALLALPVTADDGSGTGQDGTSERGSFHLPALEDPASLIDWAPLLAGEGHVDWSVVLPDPTNVRFTTNQGVTPAGVEWTRLTARHPSGVEWTRLRATDPDGSSWTKTSASEPTGVEWSFLTFEGADGAIWVQSSFLDTDGRSWSRSAPKGQLDGVEWT